MGEMLTRCPAAVCHRMLSAQHLLLQIQQEISLGLSPVPRGSSGTENPLRMSCSCLLGSLLLFLLIESSLLVAVICEMLYETKSLA